MKISIIIPVCNVAQYIERCLDSVFAQICEEELECILVNDCSPDNSIDIANKVIAGYHGMIDVKVLHHSENRGLSAARNLGMRHAKGDYIYFLDSDDEITDSCIQELSLLAKKYIGVDIVQGNVILTNERLNALESSQYNFPEYTADIEWIKEAIFSNFPMTATNKLIRKDFILKNDLWFLEGVVHEDEYWRFAAYRHMRSVAFCNIPTYIYYTNEGSITTAKYKDENFHSCLHIYRKWL